MSSFNKVVLVGNLTRDPELRTMPNGNHVLEMTLAMNRKFRTADNTEREEVCFVRITVFGRQAENCGRFLRKGSQALVEGRLKTDEWEKDGQRMSRLGVVAESVQFLGAPRRSGEYGDAPEPRGGDEPGPRPAARGGFAPRDDRRGAPPASPERFEANTGSMDGTDEDPPPF